ncbi:MAG: glycogen debranching N-terminal domain-containing protein [Gemmatimonadota bacterium]
MNERLVVEDEFSILASSVAADLPKVVLKQGEAFLVSDRRGNFPSQLPGELGFYVEGTRFLDCLELRIDGVAPLLLHSSVSEDNCQILVGLTNAPVHREGKAVAAQGSLSIERRITLYENQLVQTVSAENFLLEPLEVTVELLFGADFADVFEVRGSRRPARGVMLEAEVTGASIRLGYRGRDGFIRRTRLDFEPHPEELREGRAVFRLRLQSRQAAHLAVTVTAEGEEVGPRGLTLGEATGRIRGERVEREKLGSRIQTSHELFSSWLDRSQRDLQMLTTQTPQGPVPYAGIPWYVAPFGRDSLITALQILPFHPDVAAGTLRYLAHHQATGEDPFTDAEPGKILHEFRRGEMANCREIPFLPYYGSADTTPLFLILLAETFDWTGDRKLLEELWPAARKALAWIETRADMDGDGYVKYQTRSPRGLSNQGWKDSHDAIFHATGDLARPPISVVEVQGYCYAAFEGAARLAEVLGERATPARLRDRARGLRRRFNEDFWLPNEEYFALALDAKKRPCRVVTSNPGHCLWTRIAEPERARAVAARLLAEDMFSGWGVRTLSSQEIRYSPMSYHNGSVWPHDNAIVAAGLKRYGLEDAFSMVTTALFESSFYFERSRLPELFCGFPRVPYYGPTAYPVACSPQAWAAGVPFQLVGVMLGLEPDGAGNRLTLMNPILPSWLQWIELQNLRVGAATVDLVVARGRQHAAVEVTERQGKVELVVHQ